MTRIRKGAVVEKFEHPKTKREAAIRLEKPSMVFFSTIETAAGVEETFESKDGSDVREWLYKHLAYATADLLMEWIPVIQITERGESDRYRYRDSTDEERTQVVGLSIERYYLGITPNGHEWRKLSWEECSDDSPACIEPGLRYGQAHHFREGPKAPKRDGYHSNERKFNLPFFEGERGDGATSYLRFTPDLWAGLSAIVQRLKDTEKLLHKMIHTKDGIATVTAIGAGTSPLLLAPGDKK